MGFSPQTFIIKWKSALSLREYELTGSMWLGPLLERSNTKESKEKKKKNILVSLTLLYFQEVLLVCVVRWVHYSWRRYTTGSKEKPFVGMVIPMRWKLLLRKQKETFTWFELEFYQSVLLWVAVNFLRHQADLSGRPGDSVVPTVSHLTTEMATEKAAAQNKISVPIKASLPC